MSHSTPEQNNTPKKNSFCLYLAVLYLFGIAWASVIQNDQEDLWHFVPATWEEMCHAAGMSWLAWNARFGEMACYFVGDHFRLWVLLLHPLCLALSVASLFKLALGEWPNNSRKSLVTLIFITLSVLAMHSGVSWFNGNCSWFYPCSLAIFFFAMAEHVFHGDFGISRNRLLLLLPLAVVVGMSNENTSCVSLLLYGGAGIYWKWKSKAKWGIPYTIILVTMLLSAILFFCAPARSARSLDAEWSLTFDCILNHSILNTANWGYIVICFWRLTVVGTILLLWKPKLNHILRTPRYLLMGIGFMMLWGILILAPCWGAPRAYCPMEFLFICILTALFHAKAAHAAWFSTAGILVIHITVMMSMIWPQSVVTWARYKAWTHIAKAAEQAKSQGLDTLVIQEADEFFHAPVKRLWGLPHFVYPYKERIGILILPTPANSTYCSYVEVTLPDWEKGGDNRSLAKRLGLQRILWEYHREKREQGKDLPSIPGGNQ